MFHKTLPLPILSSFLRHLYSDVLISTFVDLLQAQGRLRLLELKGYDRYLLGSPRDEVEFCLEPNLEGGNRLIHLLLDSHKGMLILVLLDPSHTGSRKPFLKLVKGGYTSFRKMIQPSSYRPYKTGWKSSAVHFTTGVLERHQGLKSMMCSSGSIFPVNLVNVGSFIPSSMVALLILGEKGASPASFVLVPLLVCPSTLSVRASICFCNEVTISVEGVGPITPGARAC
ncbi:hypothetical protein LIER_30559 [Lithospermum erythrorhizon]|uniref:Uncharacterized protein n=1 Tax=Lithospermum erythrorhizon TaxID=34254 RepID=A0AAV3RPY3_LITER